MTVRNEGGRDSYVLKSLGARISDERDALMNPLIKNGRGSEEDKE